MRRWSISDGADSLGCLAGDCLIDEVNLTPKPGLVDQRGSGAHADLTLVMMEASARALVPMFSRIAQVSWGREPDAALRREIGRIGREGEAVMMKTTGGVNTHRGAIWTLGLLSAGCAVCRLEGGASDWVRAAGILARTRDDGYTEKGLSHGARVKQLYRVGGAKEEAQAGFPHIMEWGLPMLRKSRDEGLGEDESAINALLAIMVSLSDTCVLSRGGLQGLELLQDGARKSLRAGGMRTPLGQAAYRELDEQLQTQGLSPGGAADLLAGTFFIDRAMCDRRN